jgi:hypothetical protein
VEIVGDVGTALGVLLLFIQPADLTTIGLTLLGFSVLAYNYLVRKPRAENKARQQRREVDMLELRIEQLEHLLARDDDRS